MLTYEPAEVAGLGEAERAFRLSTGELVVTSFSRREATSDGWIAFNVNARVINEDGTTAEIDGVPLIVPTTTVSIHGTALAAGSVTVESLRAQHTAEVIQRVCNYAAAIRAWSRVPAAPDAREPQG